MAGKIHGSVKTTELSLNNNATIEIISSSFWGCISCDDEFVAQDIPKPDDGLCLPCREIAFNQRGET